MPRLGAMLHSGYAPAATPAPESEDLSPQQVGIHEGRGWNPDRGNTHRSADDSVAVPVGGLPPEMDVPGVPARRVRAGTHSWTITAQPPAEELGHVNHGLHVTQRKGIRTPAGDQIAAVPRRNTFRAAPAPWDAGVFVGVPTDQGAGQ